LITANNHTSTESDMPLTSPDLSLILNDCTIVDANNLFTSCILDNNMVKISKKYPQ